MRTDGKSWQTAQVASQEGKYLGRKLNKLAMQRETLEANGVKDLDEAVSGSFRYRHLGSLAYIGNAAVFDLGNLSFMGGLIAMYTWRSVYWSEQVSARTRALLMIDWIIRYVPHIGVCAVRQAHGYLPKGVYGVVISRSCDTVSHEQYVPTSFL